MLRENGTLFSFLTLFQDKYGALQLITPGTPGRREVVQSGHAVSGLGVRGREFRAVDAN